MGKPGTVNQDTPRAKRAREKRVGDQSTWRTRLHASKVKFDERQKDRYLDHLAKTGRKMEACRVAGVCRNTVTKHLEADPDFAEAVEEALAFYADTVHALALKLMNGVKEPIIGGKDKDQVVAYKLNHATNLVAMELRRMFPDYKDRQEIDLKGTGGVLVAPADKTPQQWIEEQQAANAQRQEPGGKVEG